MTSACFPKNIDKLRIYWTRVECSYRITYARTLKQKSHTLHFSMSYVKDERFAVDVTTEKGLYAKHGVGVRGLPRAVMENTMEGEGARKQGEGVVGSRLQSLVCT